MSTVRTNNILDASGGNTATINSMTPTADSLQGQRNRIINGDMRIAQRGTGSTSVQTSTTYASCDRWASYATQNSKYTVQQSSTAPTGFSNSLLATSSAATSVSASDYYLFTQSLEGYNFADLGFGTANAKTVTLSFQVYSSLTGTFGGSLANYAGSRSYPFTYTISAANTWTTASVTIAGDTTGTWVGASNAGAVILYFGLGVGTTYSGTAGAWAAANYFSATGATSVVGTNGATFYITGVQLEVGSVATPFERRDYGRELIMCQRYYQQVGQTNNTAFQPYANGFVSSSTRASIIYNFPVTMRSAPTFTFNGATNTYLSSAVSVTAVNIDIASVYNVMYNADVASGLTAGNATRHYQNSTNASSITLSSEL